MMKTNKGLEKGTFFIAVLLAILSIFALTQNTLARADSDSDDAKVCISTDPKYVSNACDHFNAPYDECEVSIDEEFVAAGHSDPNVNSNDSMGEIAADTGLSIDEVTSLVCHGGAGAGGGGN